MKGDLKQLALLAGGVFAGMFLYNLLIKYFPKMP